MFPSSNFSQPSNNPIIPSGYPTQNLNNETTQVTVNRQDPIIQEISATTISKTNNSSAINRQPTITSDLPSPRVDRLLNKVDFQSNLASWVQAGLMKTPQERRQWAADLITLAYRTNSTSLTLCPQKNDKLSTLPEAICNLIQLTSLDLSSNNLSVLPDNIGFLKNLTDLKLSDNKLTSFPASFGSFVDLMKLDITNNRFDALPAFFDKFLSLWDLKHDEKVNTDLTPETNAKLSAIQNLITWELDENDEKGRFFRARAVNMIKSAFGTFGMQSLNLEMFGLTSLPEAIIYLHRVTEINLSGNNLTVLPKGMEKLKHLKSLILNGNPFATFPKEICSFQNLESLSIRNIGATSFPKEILKLTKLTYLCLGNNSIQDIPYEIKALTNLNELILDHTGLENFPEAITELKLLKKLTLDNNTITSIPQTIQSLEKLESLHLNNVGLTEFPEAITNLHTLTLLYISGNSFGSISEKINSLVNLEHLALHNNNLMSLSPLIGNLIKLQYLYLAGNQINILPESLNNLRAIVELTLNENVCIDRLRGHIKTKAISAKLKRWEKRALITMPNASHVAQSILMAYNSSYSCLNLSNQRLTSLPQVIGDLNNLEELILENNLLNKLPTSIGKLKKLKKLNINSNKILNIPSWISKMTELQFFSAIDCGLTELPEWIENLTKLEELYLNNNSITTLPLKMLTLTQLKSFDIRGNNISELPDDFCALDIIENLLLGETLSLFLSIHLRKWVASEPSEEKRVIRQNAALQIINSCNVSDDPLSIPMPLSIDLSGLKLKTLPEVLCIIPNLMILKLNDMQLESLPESIGKIKHLHQLDVSNNKLSSLPESFGNLKNLQQLDITNNSFETIPPLIDKLDSLGSFTYNDTLSLDTIPEIKEKFLAIKDLSNWIETGGDQANRKNREIVANLIETALKCSSHNFKLEFQNLGLTSLPNAIVYLYKLEHLDLSGNQITKLPKGIEKLKNLKFLALDKNPLHSFPDKVDCLTNLEYFSASHIDLKEFPLSITKLSNLQILNLSSNKISLIPKEISSLVNLIDLSLENNQIEKLPNSIGLLTKLESLNLGINHLKTLPPHIGNLTKLREFDISQNCLVSLPNEIGRLENLELIDGNNNVNLQTLPMTLGECINLTEINFDDTDIPPAEIEAIQERIELAVKEGEQMKLSERVPLWIKYSKKNYELEDLYDLLQFTRIEQGNISEWLKLLESANDFNTKRTELAVLTCDILETLSQSSQSKDALQFKDAFFSQLSENLEACGDRASMLFNLICTEWVLHKLREDITIQDRVDLLVALAKTLTFRNVLREMVEAYEKKNGQLEESTEIYLYYETQLKKELGLLTPIDNPIYGTIGNRPSVIDVDTLKMRVFKDYLQILIELPTVERILELDSDFNLYLEQKKMINDAAIKALENLDASLSGTEIVSDGTYHENSKKIVVQKERCIANLRKRFLNTYLSDKEWY